MSNSTKQKAHDDEFLFEYVNIYTLQIEFVAIHNKSHQLSEIEASLWADKLGHCFAVYVWRCSAAWNCPMLELAGNACATVRDDQKLAMKSLCTALYFLYSVSSGRRVRGF